MKFLRALLLVVVYIIALPVELLHQVVGWLVIMPYMVYIKKYSTWKEAIEYWLKGAKIGHEIRTNFINTGKFITSEDGSI